MFNFTDEELAELKERIAKRVIFKVGDKVSLKHGIIRGRYKRGTITSINGGYIYVTLNYQDIVCEVYSDEIVLTNKKKQ